MHSFSIAALAIVGLSTVLIGSAQAQDDLQAASQNPIASLISVPFQNNLFFNLGEEDKTQYVLNFQPVVPIELTDDWNLIFRPITPIIAKPRMFDGDSTAFGLGDMNPQLFFVPDATVDTAIGTMTWGVGPSFQLPTATDKTLGSGQWSAGPAAVAFFANGNWTYGGLVSNIWSFAGRNKRADVNLLVAQPFVNYNLSDGWSLGAGPVITANWEADGDNVWTVPVGGGISKLFKVGDRPIKAALNTYYNAVRPDNAADWQLQFQLTFLFPE
jgi:hypothetical protein